VDRQDVQRWIAGLLARYSPAYASNQYRALQQLIVPAVNPLLHAGVRFYDGRAAARYILCIRKEVLAMFAHRQTPPGVAL
jgi:hypothetical protein